MHSFQVWAPKARTVGVQVAGVTHSLAASEGGWWEGTVAAAGPGTLYSYMLDDGQPLPDPRSQYQPEGVNGPSQIIDHSAFRWTDKNWQAKPLSAAVIYELHLGTFTRKGTFLSAIACLDHLVDLGVTHVELMPVNEFSGRVGWGYDGVDLFAPHHGYGTPDDLKELVDTCHAKGLAVLLDVVYNHFGPSGNYLPQFGPYFTEDYHTPWGAAVNFDHAGSYEVRRFFLDNATMWLRDYHIDGLRLDAIYAYYDRSATHILEELSSEVDSLSAHLGRHFVLIAESDLNDPRVVTPREAGGFGIDAQWSDDFHHALHSVLTGETNGYYSDFGLIEHLAQALKGAYVYNGRHSRSRDRTHGRPIGNLSGHHFLGYAQNHDQIGNRANGERLAHLVSIEHAKIAAALVLTSPFIPMLFQGEEFGSSAPFQYFTQHENEELARSVSEGRRGEFAAFGWSPDEIPDPQDQATYERSQLDWLEITSEEHADLLEWHKRLISLRRTYSDLTSGNLDEVEIRFSEEEHWLAMKRGQLDVVCNFGSKPCCVTVKKSSILLASDPECAADQGHVKMPATSVAILT